MKVEGSTLCTSGCHGRWPDLQVGELDKSTLTPTDRRRSSLLETA
jgi:hypothetical protein